MREVKFPTLFYIIMRVSRCEYPGAYPVGLFACLCGCSTVQIAMSTMVSLFAKTQDLRVILVLR